jgi:hypothetical protein
LDAVVPPVAVSITAGEAVFEQFSRFDMAGIPGMFHSKWN